jgi:hypothetical protein
LLYRILAINDLNVRHVDAVDPNDTPRDGSADDEVTRPVENFVNAPSDIDGVAIQNSVTVEKVNKFAVNQPETKRFHHAALADRIVDEVPDESHGAPFVNQGQISSHGLQQVRSVDLIVGIHCSADEARELQRLILRDIHAMMLAHH